MDIKKLQRVVVDALEDVKAQNIKVFNTVGLSDMFDRVVLASGSSNRQTRALAWRVAQQVKEAGGHVVSVEGAEAGEWVLVDLGDMVVHVMQPAIRDYYGLEEIWGGKPVRVKTFDPAAKRIAAHASGDGEDAALADAPVEPASAVEPAVPAAEPEAEATPAAKPVEKRSSKASTTATSKAAPKKATPGAVVKSTAKSAQKPAPKKVAARSPAAAKRATAPKVVVKKAAVKKAVAKKTAAKKAPAKKAAKPVAKKAPVTKPAVKKVAAKKTPAKKAASKKPAARKPAARKKAKA